MEFRAAHGCYALEQKVGGNFEVDVILTVEGGDAPEADDVAGTVNYVEVYETVREQMATVSAIIENVALRIASAIRARFAQVKRVEVTVSKLAPPIGGKASKVSVTLSE
jgi:dihydroneopterin aldolase